MAAERAPYRAIAAIPPLLMRLIRFGAVVTVIVFVLFCTLLLALRFVVFPRVDDYRGALTTELSEQLGQPVEIDRLTTGWDGWNPKLVVNGFRVRDRALSAAPLLELPKVELIVAWTSIPVLDLRLKQFRIDGPRLALRRDKAGMLHIAGMEIDPREHEDYGIADWILRQPQIEIHDAQLIWNDELRNAPPLVLEDVQLRLASGFGHHRFGLRGTPPGELAGPIDVRGDLKGISSKNWLNTEGRLYARLDYADIAAWRDWLPLPVRMASGKGALRLWFDFAGDEPKDIVADLELAGVKAKLRPDLPELELDSLSGRVGWRAKSPEHAVYARQLAFVTTGGLRLQPTDFSLTLRDGDGGKSGTGLLEFERLQLAPLRELAVHLPLPENLRADLARFSPRGTLTHGRFLWEGPPDAPTAFSASGAFADVSVVAQESVPGVQQLTGHLEATQAGGRIKLASRNAVVELPRVFADPMSFAHVNGDVVWERHPGRTAVRFERIEFANADATGSAAGQYRTAEKGPGEIDLAIQLARVDTSHVYRYIPQAAGESVRQWLRSSLGKGRADEMKLKLVGNLADFPFADGKGGQFLMTTKGRDLSLDYTKGWPALLAADAEVRIDGARLTIDLARGRIADIPIEKAKAEIADMRKHPVLRIEGEAAGATPDFLRFVNTSPVAGWIDNYTDKTKATGNGKLNLKLELPLTDPSGRKVGGEYLFVNNQLTLPGVPALNQVNGKLVFTDHDMRAQDVAVETLGGPAKLSVTAGNGRVRVIGNGASSVAALRREYDFPYSDVLSGNLDWTITADVSQQGSTWTLASNMKGVAVDLPAPAGKTAADSAPLKVERHAIGEHPNEDTLTIDYGSIGRLLVHRKLAADGGSADRALLLIGPAAARSADARADRPGLWIRGELAALNADDWLVVRRRGKAGSSDSGSGLLLNGGELDVGVLDAFGRRFHDMKISARGRDEDWRLELRSRELAGRTGWIAPNPKAPNGRIVARLSRLTLPEAGTPATWKTAPAPADAAKADGGSENQWPELNIETDSYLLRGRDIGRLALSAHPRGADWQIDKLTLVNDAGRVDADGWWRVAGSRQQTKLDFVLDVKDAGAYLQRLGHPDAIKTGPTKINGKLEWAGPPSAFDYPTLGGAFRIETGAGRFTKIDPGMGKLLGVLSLQALPRRMVLDFTDVFSEGFAFDQIVGDVSIQNGVMKTSDLRLNGPAAKIIVSGEADLAKETQQLTVRVHPSLSGGVGGATALLMLANPIVGAAVGAGSLLARQVMREPMEKIFSYEYQVTGTWSDPVVARRGPVTAAAPSQPTK